MRKLSDSGAMSEARRFKTLTLSRSAGSGGGVAMPQPMAQNQMIIANPTPAWSLLAAPSAEGQALIAGADPHTPAWGTVFPAEMQFQANVGFGGISDPDYSIHTDGVIMVGDYILSRNEGTCGYLSYRYTDDATGPYWSSRKARGDIAGPTIVSDGDTLWDLAVMGHDGVAWAPAASIQVKVDGTPDTDDMPGMILFRTSPAGSDTPLTRVRIRSTGVTEFYNGITFSGATGVNVVTVPDNAAQAMHLVDAGGIEYMRVVSTNAQPVVVFNEGGADVDHRWEAVGQPNALFVRGSDGKIGIWTTTINAARVEIGGATGPAIVNLPTNLSTIDAGLSTRDIANECIIVFGANVHSAYTGRIAQGEAGACIRVDTRDHDGGTTDKYTVFQVLTRAAEVAEGSYTVPFQIAGGAPTASLWITRAGAVNTRENSATVRLSGTRAFAATILSPEVGTYCQIRIPLACTVIGVYGNTVGGTSCTLNIEERSSLGDAGTNILSSDMVADANGESVTSGFNNSSLAAGNHLTFDVSAVSGAVSEVNISVTVILT